MDSNSERERKKAAHRTETMEVDKPDYYDHLQLSPVFTHPTFCSVHIYCTEFGPNSSQVTVPRKESSLLLDLSVPCLSLRYTQMKRCHCCFVNLPHNTEIVCTLPCTVIQKMISLQACAFMSLVNCV